MKALAFYHGPQRVIEMANAFARGCARHGVPCDLRCAEPFDGNVENVNAVWMYGLGSTKAVFDSYADKALRIIGDVGYWRGSRDIDLPERKMRIALDAQQPDKHLRLRKHPVDRFMALQIVCEPAMLRGNNILVCGHSVAQAGKFGEPYGAWEICLVERLRKVSKRPIEMREKPKNPAHDIPGTTRCSEHKIGDAVRKAWAVVFRSGNVGADCILHGVPAFAESGPAKAYQRLTLEQIDQAVPLSAQERLSALSDLAYWQWSRNEIAAGMLWDHLRVEGVLR